MPKLRTSVDFEFFPVDISGEMLIYIYICMYIWTYVCMYLKQLMKLKFCLFVYITKEYFLYILMYVFVPYI